LEAKKKFGFFFFFTKVTGLLYLYGIVEDREEEEEAVKELLGHVSLHIWLLMDALVFLW
jgi:hypothetical protein